MYMYIRIETKHHDGMIVIVHRVLLDSSRNEQHNSEPASSENTIGPPISSFNVVTVGPLSLAIVTDGPPFPGYYVVTGRVCHSLAIM